MIAVWYGCDGTTGHGYHPRWLNDQWTADLTPWGHQLDASTMYPSEVEGVARLHHKSGWTALQFADRTGDRRGGSHTAFLFEADLSFDEALTAARERWPRLFARFTFDVVPEHASVAASGEIAAAARATRRVSRILSRVVDVDAFGDSHPLDERGVSEG